MEMDVRHYFDAVDFDAYSEFNQSSWRYSMGAAIEKNTNALTFEKFNKLDVVIFGAPFDSRKSETNRSDAPDKTRQELFNLAKSEQKLNIVDFGNLKLSSSLKGNYQALRDIVEYLDELKIPTIVIGGSQDLCYGICEAYKSKKLFTYTTIDALLDIKKSKEPLSSVNYLSRIFSSNPNLFQFSLIGYQRHFTAQEYFFKTKGINHHVSLGKLRDNLLCAEPIFRNSDVLSFDIGAIKYADAPAGNCLNPNGLGSEEACQLAKYAGMSERLKVFGIFEIDTDKDQYNLTVKLSAQIIWYYIEGVANRKTVEINSDENTIIYQVDVKNISKPLVFQKNALTNQWWMKIQTFNNEKILLACTEEDYRQASKNDIPEMWLKYIQKIDEILK